MMTYILICWEFFKTGLFSIGGGLATLPFLFGMAEKYRWFTTDQLTQMIAVSESTPGPIGVNMATYVGFTTGSATDGILSGILGGIAATVSLITPSIITIIIIACILDKFKDSITVKNAFYGLRAAVVGLLAVSILSVFTQTFLIAGAEALLSVIDFKKVALFAVILFLVFKFKKHPILYLAIGAVFGIVLGL